MTSKVTVHEGNIQSVEEVMSNAVSAGIISSQSQQVITTDLDDIALAGCGGVDIDDIDSEDVTLVSVVLDCSGSMYEHAQEVIDSYNTRFLRPMKSAKNAESILVSVWVFSSGRNPDNVRLVHGYTPVPQCPNLTANDYDPNGGTPLYDAVLKSLTGVVSYGQTLRDNGTRTKSIVIVLSDGWENDSRVSASKVRRISADVLRAQEFVLSYVFFGDQSEGDKAAQDIGFPPHHRLTDDKDDSGIRRVLGQMSASVISTSQAQVSSGSISANAFFQNP